MWDLEKDKELNAFLTFVFTCRICIQESQASEASRRWQHSEDLAEVEEEQVRERLNKLETNKSVRPDRMYP